MEQGPSWYYNGVAVVGLLVASLLFFNSLFMLGRAIRGYQKGHQGNVLASAWGMLVNLSLIHICGYHRERFF